MSDPLRVCRFCGLEAHNEEDLDLFVKIRRSLHGRDSQCKKCHNTNRNKHRNSRQKEFIKIFRARSPDNTIICYFCGKEITELSGRGGYALNIHSLDGNHENWEITNKVPTHAICHNSYHSTGKKNPRWKGDEASRSAKSHRRIYKKRVPTFVRHLHSQQTIYPNKPLRG